MTIGPMTTGAIAIPIRARTTAVARPIPIADIAPWAVFAAVVALILLYFVSTEQGAFAIFKGMYVHEYVHDGRHLLGFPCH
jgi:hypothetical protein